MAIDSGHLSEVKTVVGETAACRRSLVHTLYPGMEAFESGADTRVSDCVDVHMIDSRVPRCRHAAANDFVVATVDGFRILEREIDLVAQLADNFLLRGDRQIYEAMVRKHHSHMGVEITNLLRSLSIAE